MAFVYGTDWEVAAEMNEHFDTMFLDNYESVLWYSHDNYPAINIWKLDNAIYNSDFNGTTIDVQMEHMDCLEVLMVMVVVTIVGTITGQLLHQNLIFTIKMELWNCLE